MALDASYDTKTIEELHAEFCQLGVDVSATSDKRAEILKLIEKRKAEAKAAAHVADLSAVERDALKRALDARLMQ